MIPALVCTEVARFQSLYAVLPPEPWIGNAPYAWAESVHAGLGARFGLSIAPISRVELRAMWADLCQSTESCILSTLAWGGMQRGNARRLWAACAQWRSLCQALREGKHTRETGFATFRTLRRNGQLPGMGPAYFTKILFFALPEGDAYILDQWTARSLHMLSGQGTAPPIRKDYATAKKAMTLGLPAKLRVIVSDSTTVDHYVAYCSRVEELARLLDLHPHEVEQRLFSSGGTSPHGWRAYVMTAWNAGERGFYG